MGSDMDFVSTTTAAAGYSLTEQLVRELKADVPSPFDNSSAAKQLKALLRGPSSGGMGGGGGGSATLPSNIAYVDVTNTFAKPQFITSSDQTVTTVEDFGTSGASVIVRAEGQTAATINALSQYAALQSICVADPDGTITTPGFLGGFFNTYVASGNSQNINTGLNAMFGQVDHFGTGGVATASGMTQILYIRSTGTIDAAFGLYIYLDRNGGSGHFGNAYGIYVDRQYTAGAVVTTGTALYLEDWSSDGAPTNYNLFSNGANSTNVLQGRVDIGRTTAGDAAAKLQVDSTTRGFLPPRMTEAQRDAIASPPAGLIVYNTTTNKLNFYSGSAWEAVTSA